MYKNPSHRCFITINLYFQHSNIYWNMDVYSEKFCARKILLLHRECVLLKIQKIPVCISTKRIPFWTWSSFTVWIFFINVSLRITTGSLLLLWITNLASIVFLLTKCVFSFMYYWHRTSKIGFLYYEHYMFFY